MSKRKFLGLSGGCIAVVSLLMFVWPKLAREDGIVEWMTAFTFLGATAVAAYLFGSPGLLRNRSDRLAMLGISLFALLLAMSEVSFGARLFGVRMPAMQGGGEFDGGHDVVIWSLRKLANSSGTIQLLVGVLMMLGATVLVSWMWRQRETLRVMVTAFLSHPVRFKFVLALVLLAGAVCLDLIPNRRISMVEEAMEFVASLALLASVLQASPTKAIFTGWSSRPQIGL